MEYNASRRRVLAASATTAVGALAGCGALRDLGGGESPARDWVYDPRAFEGENADPEGSVVKGSYRAPARLAAQSEHFHDDATDWRDADPYRSGIPVDDVEWTMRVADPLLERPRVVALAGSFDADAAREGIPRLGEAFDSTPRSAGSVGGFDLLAFDEESHGAYRDGRAVAVGAAGTEAARRLLEAVDDDERWVDSSGNPVGLLLDELGFEDTMQFGIRRNEDGGIVSAVGSSYAISGDTTTARYAWYGRRSAAQLEELGEDIDALRDFSVDAKGAVAWLSGTADTDRLAFDGALFALGQAPYD